MKLEFSGKSIPLWINKFDRGDMQISTSESNGSCQRSRVLTLVRPKPPATFVALTGGGRKQILSIWDKADLIKVSDVELEFLTGSDKIDDASALSLWHPNLKLLLVTLGENGSRYYTKVKQDLIFNFYFVLFLH